MAVDHKRQLDLAELQELHNFPDRVPCQIVQVLEALTQENEETRAWAADCLSVVVQLDEHQTSQVSEFCSHENEFVANWACKTLAKSKHLDQFQDRLVEALEKHPSTGVKQSAANALAGLSKASPHTVQALQAATQFADARLQRLAKAALQNHVPVT